MKEISWKIHCNTVNFIDAVPIFSYYRSTLLSFRMGIHVDVGPNQRVILNGNFLPVTFRNQSKELSRDVVHYVACPQDAPQPRNRRIQIMRNLVDDMIKDREQMLKDMVKALDIQDASQLKLIHNIATQMFDDQVVTWGRIVTLYSFCSYLARGCLQVNIDDCTDTIADILSDIVINRLGLWIVSNGGWVNKLNFLIIVSSVLFFFFYI